MKENFGSNHRPDVTNSDRIEKQDPVAIIMGRWAEMEATGNMDVERPEIKRILNLLRNGEILGEEAIEKIEEMEKRRIER